MMAALQLHIGRRDTGICIRPDGLYPEMWRAIWGDGSLSPMANLARVKDAGVPINEAAHPWHTDRLRSRLLGRD